MIYLKAIINSNGRNGRGMNKEFVCVGEGEQFGGVRNVPIDSQCAYCVAEADTSCIGSTESKNGMEGLSSEARFGRSGSRYMSDTMALHAPTAVLPFLKSLLLVYPTTFKNVLCQSTSMMLVKCLANPRRRSHAPCPTFWTDRWEHCLNMNPTSFRSYVKEQEKCWYEFFDD